ncbi:hypothetical protein RB980_002081 [Vibrio fluvialis]|uniref:hypothetical protein n=1 Tax=Vibrio sp. bablab_jr001 TaxID=2755067 RepID=UPI0018F1ADF7|nr:hypothetical protein [Vibrio sp. bablab_jr001]ELE8119474.1 hypothetical protein [Vibrio fluvialis]
MGKYKILWLMCAAVAFVQIALGVVIHYELPGWDERNAFGGMFGAVNTLFSGFAFCGVIYAIILQRKELELQREELKATREELSLHRGELARSSSAQVEQAELMYRAAKINATSTRLQIASTMYINQRDIPKGSLNGYGDTSYNSRDELRNAYKELLELSKY